MRILGVILTSALVATASLASADAGLRQLFRFEKTSLETMPEVYLRNLLTEPQRKQTSEVEFTWDWVDAQPKATGDDQFACLSEALYFEARGETVKGQFAVAEVILNRVASSQFPDTLCGVINQGTGRKYQCQFTYTCDGRAEVISEKRAHDRVSKVARAAMDGKAAPLTDGATYYHTTAVRPSWSRKFDRTAKIGVHLFYKPSVRTASN